MYEIDWKRKLTSRKLWSEICGFIAGMIAAFGGSESIQIRVTGLIMSAASIAAYIISEGLADAAGVKTDTIIVEPDKPPEDDDDMR